MKTFLKQSTIAYIFSYLQVRDKCLVPSGELEIIKLEYTDWGEEVVTFKGYPPFITETYWGPTPFKKALIYVE